MNILFDSVWRVHWESFMWNWIFSCCCGREPFEASFSLTFSGDFVRIYGFTLVKPYKFRYMERGLSKSQIFLQNHLWNEALKAFCSREIIEREKSNF